MKIQNSQNPINFNGLYFKKVSPQIQEAFGECPAIQKLSLNNDVFISQFQRKVQEPYGKILEYGYRCKIVEPANFFRPDRKLIFDGISETALDLSKYKNQNEINNTVTNDIVEEIGYIHNVKDFIENFCKVIKKDFDI